MNSGIHRPLPSQPPQAPAPPKRPTPAVEPLSGKGTDSTVVSIQVPHDMAGKDTMENSAEATPGHSLPAQHPERRQARYRHPFIPPQRRLIYLRLLAAQENLRRIEFW
jgi:hypothetical protein